MDVAIVKTFEHQRLEANLRDYQLQGVMDSVGLVIDSQRWVINGESGHGSLCKAIHSKSK